MNHDATHCANFCEDCPTECYRAQLAIDLQNKWEKFINIPLSYSYLYGTEECILSGKNDKQHEVPSAETIQGEWIRKYDDEINCYWYECNQCGSRPPLDQWRHEWHSEYCPNCGAKMNKDGEDE